MENIIIEKININAGLIKQIKYDLSKMYEEENKNRSGCKFYEFLENCINTHDLLAKKRIEEIVKREDIIFRVDASDLLYPDDTYLIGYFVVAILDENAAVLPEILCNISDLNIERKIKIYNGIIRFFENFCKEKNVTNISIEYNIHNNVLIHCLLESGYNFIYTDEDIYLDTHLVEKKLNIKEESEVLDEGYNYCRQRKERN